MIKLETTSALGTLLTNTFLTEQPTFGSIISDLLIFKARRMPCRTLEKFQPWHVVAMPWLTHPR
jgi:uncharacterized membrane protein